MIAPLHLIISLDRTPDRWQTVSSAFNSLTGLSASRISAIDKQTISNYEIFSKDLMRPLSLGEIACFYSHRKCWETLISSNSEWALIMEDDIFFTQSSSINFLHDANWIPKNVDICQISSYKEESDEYYVKQKSRIELSDVFSLEKLMHPTCWGTQAYWMNKRAAKIALKYSERFHIPVDEFLFNQNKGISKKLNVYTLCPFVVYQNFHIPSLIDEDRKAAVAAEIKKDFFPRTIQRFRTSIQKKTCKKIIRFMG